MDEISVMKRLFDFVSASVGLFCLLPVLIPVLLLVFLQDFKNPFYIATRVGRGGLPFQMIKIRTMIQGADKSGVDSTSADDQRITPIGAFIRRCKFDEIPQLFNVIRGDMSLVGPRPNVEREVALYTDTEKKILELQPGITDISSIVFADEGEILAGKDDPDLAYNQLIRPWKSRLCILYVEKQSLSLDVKLIFLTLAVLINREKVLLTLSDAVKNLGASDELVQVCKREGALEPTAPPGADAIVTSREA